MFSSHQDIATTEWSVVRQGNKKSWSILFLYLHVDKKSTLSAPSIRTGAPIAANGEISSRHAYMHTYLHFRIFDLNILCSNSKGRKQIMQSKPTSLIRRVGE